MPPTGVLSVWKELRECVLIAQGWGLRGQGGDVEAGMGPGRGLADTRQSCAPVTSDDQCSGALRVPQMWTSAACSLTCAPTASASTALAPSAVAARLAIRRMLLPRPVWVSLPTPTVAPPLLHST